MGKYLKNTNLLRIPDVVEYDRSIPFTGGMLGKNYYNIVDFGGILPRSEATLVNNVLAKYNAQLISKDTALEELRYSDPTLELSKMTKENIDTAKLQKAIESGQTDNIGWFDWPKDENYYMLVDNKMPAVTPEQNHQEHWLEHKKAYESTQHPIIMSHIMMHEKMMQWAQSWVVSEWVSQWIEQGLPQWQPQLGMSEQGMPQWQPAQQEQWPQPGMGFNW